MPSLKNKSGTLTAYGFACGYVEKQMLPDGSEVQLYRDGCWHVRRFNPDNSRHTWECPRLLTEARRLFRSLCKV